MVRCGPLRAGRLAAWNCRQQSSFGRAALPPPSRRRGWSQAARPATSTTAVAHALPVASSDSATTEGGVPLPATRGPTRVWARIVTSPSTGWSAVSLDEPEDRKSRLEEVVPGAGVEGLPAHDEPGGPGRGVSATRDVSSATDTPRGSDATGQRVGRQASSILTPSEMASSTWAACRPPRGSGRRVPAGGEEPGSAPNRVGAPHGCRRRPLGGSRRSPWGSCAMAASRSDTASQRVRPGVGRPRHARERLAGCVCQESMEGEPEAQWKWRAAFLALGVDLDGSGVDVEDDWVRRSRRRGPGPDAFPNARHRRGGRGEHQQVELVEGGRPPSWKAAISESATAGAGVLDVRRRRSLAVEDGGRLGAHPVRVVERHPTTTGRNRRDSASPNLRRSAKAPDPWSPTWATVPMDAPPSPLQCRYRPAWGCPGGWHLVDFDTSSLPSWQTLPADCAGQLTERRE